MGIDNYIFPLEASGGSSSGVSSIGGASGAILLGDGLEMDSNTLKALGGGGKYLHKLYAAKGFDVDATSAPAKLTMDFVDDNPSPITNASILKTRYVAKYGYGSIFFTCRCSGLQVTLSDTYQVVDCSTGQIEFRNNDTMWGLYYVLQISTTQTFVQGKAKQFSSLNMTDNVIEL